MRDIEITLKNRLLSAQQTLFNNADPYMSVIVSRPKNAIIDKRYWQEAVVSEDTTAIITAVAVRKEHLWPDKVFVAYVTGTTMIVKSAVLRHSAAQMVWDVVETVAGVKRVALEFDGHFVHTTEGNVEWKTDELPTVAYVTTYGQLMCGVLGSSYVTVVSGNVLEVDIVHGFESEDKSESQGMILFYINTSNKLYSKQYIDGAWEDAEQVTMTGFPSLVSKVHAARVFDYRLVLQVEDDAGKLYEVFTKMEAHGWHANENVKARITADIDCIQVSYSTYQHVEETVVSQITMPKAETGSLFPPFMYEVFNIDDGTGDFGKVIEIEWSENIYVLNSLPNTFKITDELGRYQYAQEILGTDGWRKLQVKFINFNNFTGNLLLEYFPGTMSGCATAAIHHDINFTPVQLVPFFVPGAEPVSVENIQDWSDA